MNWLGFRTLFTKEIMRFTKVYLQTLFAPIITVLLYLLVFARVLEGRMDVFGGLSYTAFLVPGLIMMAVIQNAFANSSSSLIQSKVTGNLIFIMVTPLSYLEVYLAFTLAAVVRGVLVGLSVYIVALFFIQLPLFNIFYIFAFLFMSSAVLATLGMIAGIWAEKFDQLAGFTNFVIMPLSFLSGVFYSIHSLPPTWQMLSHFNPFFYMIDGFRYGFFGSSDVNPLFSLGVVAVFLVGLAALTLHMLNSGYKIRD